MASSDSEQVTCPSCSKSYRWKADLAGRSVPCKQCGKSFIIPDQPGLGLAEQPAPQPKHAEEDDLYELATDPDDEPELPPAFKSPPVPKAEDPSPPPTADPYGATDTAQDPVVADDVEASHTSEPAVHISEAAKASRREQQRIAAAESEAARSWQDYKGWIILASVVGLFVIIYLAMYAFSSALD